MSRNQLGLIALVCGIFGVSQAQACISKIYCQCHPCTPEQICEEEGHTEDYCKKVGARFRVALKNDSLPISSELDTSELEVQSIGQ